LEKWLEKVIADCKKELQKSTNEFKNQPVRMSMNIEAGKENLTLNVDLSQMFEKIAIPTMLLAKGFEGIAKAIECLDIPFEKDRKIKGYSESEYSVPFCLEDEEKLVLLEPVILPGLMEAFGLGEYAYGVSSVFLALDFFKYVDIINSQTKPTIMAFFGMSNFQDVSSVNFSDYLNVQLNSLNMPSKKEEIKKSIEQKNIYEFLPKNIFKAYGIPEFRVPIADGVHLSLYDPLRALDRRKLRSYANSVGITGFLNPTIVDYSLFVVNASKKTEPNTVGDIMRKGKALGHSPSESRLVPGVKPAEVLDDPMGLMKQLKALGLLTEMRGTYRLCPKGFRLVEAEIRGKPKESSLTKVWNVAKKAKEILPFLKFVTKG
jgi:hypothetical protein